MKSFSTIFSVLTLASSVWAHGYVNNVNIAGTDFPGSGPGSGSTEGVVRVITTTSPVKGAFNPDVNCGSGATAVSGLARGNPGDVMAFSWNSGSSTWPHNTGPLVTYMASCTNGDCTTFDTTQAQWFKIKEDGFDAAAGAWVQQTVMNGQPAYATIPSNLAPGQYMVRHEIIALHLATSDGGAEFYPSCTQLEVGGNGNAGPQASDLVSLPGAYSDQDAGILLNPYSAEGTTGYRFPGPQLASFVEGATGSTGGSNSGTGNSPSTTTTVDPASVPTATGTTTGQTSGGACRLKKMKKRAAMLNGTYTSHVQKRADALNRPRHVSRIMRGIDLSGA